MTYHFPLTNALLDESIEQGCFPGYCFALGDRSGELCRGYGGYRSLTPEKIKLNAETLFDMASLTKILSPTMITLRLIEEGQLSLYDKLGLFFDTPADKKEITIFHLMTHSSGLPDHFFLQEACEGPEDAVKAILSRELSYETGKEVEYTCMGYILLGKILEKITGKDLKELSEQYVFKPLAMKNTGYLPSGENIAPTEYNKELGACLKGVVHDENAGFLNGISGNAGVFSDINDMSRFVFMLANRGYDPVSKRRYLDGRIFERAVRNYTPHLSESRGLGFVINDFRLSSSGDLFSLGSYGHTGFTGTSFWVDNDTGFYAVLLTNRVHPDRSNDKIIRIRRLFHNLAMNEYERLKG